MRFVILWPACRNAPGRWPMNLLPILVLWFGVLAPATARAADDPAHPEAFRLGVSYGSFGTLSRKFPRRSHHVGESVQVCAPGVFPSV
jgi:hypothetical protein